MRAFFFHTGTPSPHFEVELELIREHEKGGDSVRVLQCNGRIKNCEWNQQHNWSRCIRCQSKFISGWKILNPGMNVELKAFPEVIPVPQCIPDQLSSIEELKRFCYDNENLGMGVASTLITTFRDHRFDIKKHQLQTLRCLTSTIQVYQVLKQALLEYKPDIVYIFNGRLMHQLPAVLLCKKLNIEYMCHERAYTPNSFTIRKNSTVHSIDAWHKEADLLWENGKEERETIGRKYFELKRQASNQLAEGLVFTKQQTTDLLPENFDHSKRNIAIYTTSLEEFCAVHGWTNLIYDPDDTAGVVAILKSFLHNERFKFYLRVHPIMQELSPQVSQLRDIRELSARFSNVHVIWPHEKMDSYALAQNCEKVLTFGSTMGIEAAFWGTPSVLLNRAFYENFECIYKPKTHEQVVELIEQKLPALNVEDALKYGYHEMSYGTKFKYVEQRGLWDCRFDGEKIKPSFFPEMAFQSHRFLQSCHRTLRNPARLSKKLRELVETKMS